MASTIWEEADGEFYQEAFLQRDRCSLSSTLDTHSDTLDSLPHRSRPMTGSNNRRQSQNSKSRTKRSERMKAAIQGLGTGDSDDEAAELVSSAFETGAGAEGIIFHNSSVITPVEAWRNGLKLKTAQLPLKTKRRIRRQSQKQPVLKQDTVEELSWKIRVFGWWLGTAWQRWINFFATFCEPSKRVERSKGRIMFRALALRKKLVMISLILWLISSLPSLITSTCCGFASCDMLYKKIYTFNSTDSQRMLLPLTYLDKFIRVNPFYVPVPNVIILSFCFVILFMHFSLKFFRLLKLRYFQLNCSSVFRQTFASWPMYPRSHDFAVKTLQKNYVSIKDQMSLNWNKWSHVSIAMAIMINLLIICATVWLSYFIIWGSPHKELLNSLPDASLLLIVSASAYVAFKHLLPTLFLALGSIGFQNNEARANFYAGRVFFGLVTFYFLLLASLQIEYPDQWTSLLVIHLFMHTVMDLLLAPVQLISVCLPSALLNLVARVLPRSHPLDALSAHETGPRYAIDLALFSIALCLSEALAMFMMLKYVIEFTVTYAVISFVEPSNQSYFSPANLEFIEVCLVWITFAVTSTFLLVPFLISSLRVCPTVTHLAPDPVWEWMERAFGQLITSPVQIVLTSALLLLGLVLLRAKVREFCLGHERAQLRRHLEDLNQDKCYQVMKQRQWYPNCKCHESRTRRTKQKSSASGSKKTEN